HHEGEEKADRRQDAGRLRRGRRAKAGSAQDGRAVGPQGGREGQDGRRTGRQTQERSRGHLMATLLLAEHDNKALKDATTKAMTAAKALGADVHVLVAGSGAKGVADAAAKIEGVVKVLLADGAPYEHALAEPLAALIVSLAGGYDAIVAPSTTTGKNVMPRVA